MFDALIADFLRPTQLPMGTVVSRLLLALLLGGLIGWEREVSARAAGLRTHMLISVAAALFAVTAMELATFHAPPETRVQADPLRLIEAVTSGVAFLAAGSIVIAGGHVRGITTGASMWMVGAVGLCCGIGDVKIALLGTFLALSVLWAVRLMVERVAGDAKERAAEEE
ncbi:MgtC/SapB family protein [Paracoccus sp. S-4012]|uniref:MgtC/SapB family protein n=1 Tax=Paracoccus sp. S-4012 TaxID=2665648 RepID=UPI0012AF08F2|nr:MgtC/SapB family protein [Paracoccus sp. S-4012]MRX50166.1 MgtC/SapB family protein [Paracoccus sp. S-4012]